MKNELERIAGAQGQYNITNEDIDAVLYIGAVETVNSIGDCMTDDKEICRSQVETILEQIVDCKTNAAKTKLFQIAKFAAAQAGADAKEADPTKTETEIELVEKNKFEAVGGPEGIFQYTKDEINEVRNGLYLNKEIMVINKPSIDIIVEYAGPCDAADDTAIKTAMDDVDVTMDVVKVGEPTTQTTDGNKCKAIFRASKKMEETAATNDELKGAIADSYTAKVGTGGRRLNGRRRLPDINTSADQTTAMETSKEPEEPKEPEVPEEPKQDPNAEPDQMQNQTQSDGAGDMTVSASDTTILGLTSIVIAIIALFAAL